MRFLLLIATIVALQGSALSQSPAAILTKTWGLVDEGEIPPYALLLRNEILSSGGVATLGATVTAVGELAWPRPNSACGHSKLINEWVDLLTQQCSKVQLADAIDSYAVVVAQAIDNLRILGQCCILPSPWPTLENSCGDWGRIYDITRVWSARPPTVGKDVGCIARRLYASFSLRAVNVGAAASSAITGPSIDLFTALQPQVLDYLALAVDQSPSACAVKKNLLRSKAGALKAAVFQQADVIKAKYLPKCI